MDIKAIGIRIVYELIAAEPQSQRGFSPSVSSIDDKEREDEVDLHVQDSAIVKYTHLIELVFSFPMVFILSKLDIY